MANGFYLWHENFLRYDFGPNHPFKTVKFQIFKDLIKEQKLNVPEVTVPGIFSNDILKSIFNPNFIDELLLKEHQKGAMLDPGTPAFPNMVEVSSTACYGTYYALKQLIDSKTNYVFNCLGGHHHGKPDKAFGGCILNDMGFAVQYLRKEGYNNKIAVIDVDFHPHDGTVDFLKDDPKVLMASIHEQGWFNYEDDYYDDFYPNVVNIPIKSNYQLSEEEYLKYFDEKIIPKVRSFQPDVILYVNGVDGHENDLVTYYGRKIKSISLSNKAYELLARKITNLAIELCKGKILGLGAGGYSPQDTAMVWFNTLKVFNELLED